MGGHQGMIRSSTQIGARTFFEGTTMNRFASIFAAAFAMSAIFSFANATMSDARASALAMVASQQAHNV
jgi:hypothetical protein